MAINLALTLTVVGKSAFWNSKNTGVKLDITHLQFGTRNRTTTGEETVLNQPKQYTEIQNGNKIAPDQVRIMATMIGKENYNVTEIGLWSGVPDQAGSILIAYRSVPTGFIAQMVKDIDLVFTYDMVISTADIDHVNIVKDTDQSSTFALLAAHTADRNSHPFYATIDTAQTISGAKTFTNKTIFSGGLTGELTGNAATVTKLKTARTISLTGDATGSVSFDGSANVSTALTLANTGIAAGTYRSLTIDTKGRATAGNDVVTGLVTSTSETGVSNLATSNTNTYLNVTEKVGTATASVGTSTQITGAGTVTVASDTAGKITITGAQSITGNAATATKLATARTIGGVSFDGTANINLPGVNTTGNQNTTGSAAKLTTARNINGVAFDGSNDINLPTFKRTASSNALVDLNDSRLDGIHTEYVWQNQPANNGIGAALNISYSPDWCSQLFFGMNGAPSLYLRTFSNGTTWANWKTLAFTDSSITGNAATATKLATARTISLTGDATGSVSFDGTANVSTALTLASTGIAAGTYKSITVDAKGRATAGTDVVTGLVTSTSATGTTNLATSNTNTFLNITEKVGTATASVGTSTQVTGAGTVTVTSDTAGKITITGAQSITGNAATATALATARTINGVAFDGSANIDVPIYTISRTAEEIDSINQSAFFRSDEGSGTLGLHIHNPTNGGYGFQIHQSGTYAKNQLKTRVKSGGTWSSYRELAYTDSDITGNAASATKLATARTLSLTGDATGSMSFDGTANASAAVTLASTGIAAGTYKSITVDAKGRATAGNDVVTGLVTSSSATGTSNLATTNTNTFLNITEKVGTATASAGTSTQVTGAGTVTVSSDTAGKITITGAQSITGNAATATKLANARTINGVTFDGTRDINVPGWHTVTSLDKRVFAPTDIVKASISTFFTSKTGLNSTTGNSDYGDFLALNGYSDASGGLINGLFFDKKSTEILHYQAAIGDTAWGTPKTLAYTDSNITGNAATATKLATARTIGGVSFDGTANINLPGVNTTGNQNTTGSAAKLATARTLSLTGDATGSLSFDGSANASAALTLASTGIAAGTYKSITVDAKGRATAGNDVVTGLVTSSSATGTSNLATTNTNTFLNITEKVGTATASAGTSTQVTGAGTVTVSSDTAGKITITGAQSITGNAATATKLATARTISLTGNATGSTTFDGSGNVSIAVNVGDDTHNHTTLSALPTYAKTAANLPMDWDKGVQATFVNTGSGYPSYGGVINIRPHDNGGGNLQLYTPYGTGYGGDTVAMRFGNYNSNGGNSWTEFKYLVHDKNIDQYAPGKTGSGASGTWGIAITGNAATATKLATVRTIGGVSFDGTANINLPGVNTTGNQSTTGNAATATKLQTARTLSLTGDATGSLSFDGSANASAALTLASTGIAAGTYRSVTVDAKGRATAGNPVVIGLVTSSTAAGVSNVATTNTNTFLNITEKVGTATASAGTSTQVVGAGTVTVSSDTAGKITITGAQSITGNAATATALATARTIGGVSFNGTANINLPGVNTTGNQNTTGSAAKLTTARTINGVSFDGTANIELPLIGYGQTWQDVTALRARDTVYINSTGSPIMISIYGETAGRSLSVSANGVDWLNVGGLGGSGDRESISIIVPNGHRYMLAGSINLDYWVELR